MSGVTVLIADDHTLFRQGLRNLLEQEDDISVVGEVSDGSEAIRLVQELLPDIVLMDIHMPGVDGIEATRQIKKNSPATGIIVLTMYEDDEHLFEAIKAGANDYVLKVSSIEKLLNNIKAVARGGSLLDSELARKVLDEFAKIARSKELQERKDKKLTQRELAVLNLMAKGHANKQIARKLFISEKTVRNHISNIYRKLNCHDRAQVMLEAVRLGLIDVEKVREEKDKGSFGTG